MDKVHDVRDMVQSAGLDSTTTQALEKALSDDSIKHIMEIGNSAHADIGNQKLLALRRSEAIEELTKELKTHGLEHVKIDEISYKDLANNMSIQSSVAGAK